MSEPQAVLTTTEEMNFFQRWFGIYFSPSKSYQSLDRKPDWVIPLLVLAIFLAVASVFMLPAIKEAQIQAVMERQGMSYEQAAEAMAKTEGYMKVVTPISTFVSIFVMAFLISGIFFLVNNYMFGGDAPYKKILSVFAYTTFAIDIVATLVKLPLIVAKNSLDVHTGLAAFLSPDMKDQFIYRLFSKVDFFTIWKLILLGIGFSVVCRFSRNKSYGIVFGLWALYVIGAVVVQSLIL